MIIVIFVILIIKSLPRYAEVHTQYVFCFVSLSADD